MPQKLPAVFLILVTYTTNSRGDSAKDLFDAVTKGDVAAVKSIIEDNNESVAELVNIRELGSGQTPIMKSVLMGKTEIAEYLLSVGEVDVTIGEKDGYTVMHGAGFQA